MTRSHLDDETATHPKHDIAADMLDSKGKPFGDATWTMWSKAIVYANKHLTDGQIQIPNLRKLTSHWAPLEVADALVAARLRPDGFGLFENRGDGTYWVHGFLDHGNPSREKVLAMRKADADRKAERYRKAKEKESALSPGRRSVGVHPESSLPPNDKPPLVGEGEGEGVGEGSGSGGGAGGAQSWPATEPADPSFRLNALRVDWSRAHDDIGAGSGFGLQAPDKLEENLALEALWVDARDRYGVSWADYPAKLRGKLVAWRESVDAKYVSRRPASLAAWISRVREDERREEQESNHDGRVPSLRRTR